MTDKGSNQFQTEGVRNIHQAKPLRDMRESLFVGNDGKQKRKKQENCFYSS
jgi:hypothetical protein